MLAFGSVRRLRIATDRRAPCDRRPSEQPRRRAARDDVICHRHHRSGALSSIPKRRLSGAPRTPRYSAAACRERDRLSPRAGGEASPIRSTPARGTIERRYRSAVRRSAGSLVPAWLAGGVRSVRRSYVLSRVDAGCWHTSVGPLGGGHALIRPRRSAWVAVMGRQVDRRTTRGRVSGQSWASPVTVTR